MGSKLGEVLREYEEGTEVKLSEGSIDGGQELGDVDSTNVDGSSSDAGSDEGEILESDEDGIEIGPDEGDIFGNDDGSCDGTDGGARVGIVEGSLDGFLVGSNKRPPMTARLMELLIKVPMMAAEMMVALQ